MLTDTEVVIAGGGPVGMGLAIELGQRGVRTVVIERYPTPQPIPKGQNLTQRTMEHMHAWGAENALRAARTIPATAGGGGLTAYGTLLSGHHYEWLKRALVSGFYSRANERLPQYATEAVLRSRAAQLPSVEIIYGSTVTDAVADSGAVRVTATDRAGQATDVTARYVVGCDGSRSVVRKAAGIEQTLSDHDRLMALLVFRSSELTRLLALFDDKLYFNVLHPAQKGYWLFLGRVDLEDRWFFHAPVPHSARSGDFDFIAMLHDTVGATFDVEMEHVGFWDLRFATADTYGRNDMFVAGDAAHSHPPYGGYGINTGFEDARNLGWKLAATLQGWAGPALLDSYHAERHAVFASTANDFIERSINTDRQFLDTFDPAVDPARFASEWTKRKFAAVDEVDRFEPHYFGSPVVFGDPATPSSAVGHHQFKAVAGHHLAPGALAFGGSVHDALGDGFTLLSLNADATTEDGFRRAAIDQNIPLTILSTDDRDLAQHYGSSLILLRPDGFVAWTEDAALSDYFNILCRCVGYS